MNFYALDLETKSLDPDHPEFALQPWRAKEGKAKITLAYAGGFHMITPFANLTADLSEIPWNMGDEFCWTWAGIFDIAFLISSGVDCSKVKWLDAMSAFKWIIRSQNTDHPSGKRFSWSLENAAKHLLKDWAHYEEFLDLKKELLDDQQYWERRCRLDTEATLLIGEKCWEKLTIKQRKGFLIEQEALYPAALAWVNGCHYDMKGSQAIAAEISKERKKIVSDLLYYGGQTTVAILMKIIDSPKKLAGLIFDSWRVPWSDEYLTEKGNRSVSQPVLQFLLERHGAQFPQLRLIKKYRELKTMNDKFVKGPQKLFDYLGSDVFHHVIRLNSTYTGRCTYSSKG